jgi:hypothetical protein
MEKGEMVQKNRGKFLGKRTAFAATLAFGLAFGAPAILFAGLGDSPMAPGSVDALMGQFTPANGDPRLMAAYDRLSVDARNAFRFTPALNNNAGTAQAMTVVVRTAPDISAMTQAKSQAAAPTLVRTDAAAAPAPIAAMRYNLGSAIGFDRFALAATPMTTKGKRLDIAALPEIKAPATSKAKPRPSRFGGDMTVGRDVLPGSDPRMLNPEQSYSVDVAGRYKISRNLDVTAGVRLRQENDRLKPLTDARQDSQAVYVGTRVKF